MLVSPQVFARAQGTEGAGATETWQSVQEVFQKLATEEICRVRVVKWHLIKTNVGLTGFVIYLSRRKSSFVVLFDRFSPTEVTEE